MRKMLKMSKKNQKKWVKMGKMGGNGNYFSAALQLPFKAVWWVFSAVAAIGLMS